MKRNWLVISKLTSVIWRILTGALESLKNFHFNGFLLSKVYIVWTKKVQRSYLSWNWRGINFSFQNWHKEFDKLSLKHSKVSKIFTLMGSFWANYLLFELKKYRGAIFHETKVRYKIWIGIDLSFQYWHKEFDKFLPEHLKVSKLELWWDPFAQSRKCMTLKFTEELCVMTMKNDTKIEEKLTCRFKTDTRNFTNFDLRTRKSKKIMF